MRYVYCVINAGQFHVSREFHADGCKLKISRLHAAAEMYDVDSWLVSWLVKLWFSELTASDRGGISVRASWAASSGKKETDDVFIIREHSWSALDKDIMKN